MTRHFHIRHKCSFKFTDRHELRNLRRQRETLLPDTLQFLAFVCGNFMTSWELVSFSRTELHGESKEDK